MANLVKAKTVISIFSVSIILAVELLETNFFMPATIKRWSKLSWDDFRGTPKPFHPYDAGIRSTIYLEYDSTLSKFRAYAGQNNVESWVKRRYGTQEYLLNHEQCHFNITELHARMLNKYIDENPNDGEYASQLRLGSLKIDLAKMQDQYDRETGHSVIFNKQSRWEFTIDSLLSNSVGWKTDLFSGARVYFPEIPDSSKGFSVFLTGFMDDVRYRNYVLTKYHMNFVLMSYLIPEFDPGTFTDRVHSMYGQKAQTMKSLSLDSLGDHFKAFVITRDTFQHTNNSLWVYEHPYLYLVLARYLNNGGDTTGYVQNADSFIRSFSIVNPDDQWIEKFKTSDEIVMHTSLVNTGSNTPKQSNCLQLGPADQLGFYRGPIFRDDGAILLAYDNLLHGDSLHRNDMLILDKEVFTSEPAAGAHVYFVPPNQVPLQTFAIKFGYTLKDDSLKKCPTFHYEGIKVTR